MISKTLTHHSQYPEEEQGQGSGDSLYTKCWKRGPELSHPGEFAPSFPASVTPYSHQFDNNWGNQQSITRPGAQEAFQYDIINYWESQQATPTTAAQKAALGQDQPERTQPSTTASTFFYRQLADDQSLDIPRAINLHTALEIPPDGPNPDIQPSNTFSVPFDPQFVNNWSTDTSVSHEEPPYRRRRASVRKTASPSPNPSVSVKPGFDAPSASSGNSTNLARSSPNKSGVAFQCPTCNKSFSRRHQLK